MEIIISRPYGAEDNDLNKTAREIIEHWADRHHETIAELKIYVLSVSATMESGREIYASETDGCKSRYRNVREHFYMNEKVNGKAKRIPKAEW